MDALKLQTSNKIFSLKLLSIYKYIMSQNFKVETSNYLGFEYEEYLNELMALAVSTPSKYYEIRAKTLKALKQDVISAVYKTYYDLLTTGTINEVNTLNGLKPAYPQQKASQFSLAASKTINEILNSALEIILPANHLDVAKMKLSQKGEASKIE
jgi:hypothetical protein